MQQRAHAQACASMHYLRRRGLCCARGASDRDYVAAGRDIEMHYRLRCIEFEHFVVVIAHGDVK
jgi:hypothetical protein